MQKISQRRQNDSQREGTQPTVTVRIEGALRGTWGLELTGLICADRTWWEAGPHRFMANRGQRAKEARLHRGSYKEP